MLLKLSWLFLFAGRRGRPAIDVTREHIEFLLKQGHTIAKTAEILGCSSSFLYNKLMGIPVRSMLSAIDDGELEQRVRQLQSQYLNSGNEVIGGLYLWALFNSHLCAIVLWISCEFRSFKNLFQMMRALLHTQGVLVTRSRVHERLTRVNPCLSCTLPQ